MATPRHLRIHMPRGTRAPAWAGLLTAGLIACSLGTGGPAGAAPAPAAAQLPPELAAGLDRDIAAAEAKLAAERRQLLPIVTRQRASQAAVGRLEQDAERLEPLAEVARLFEGEAGAKAVAAPIEQASTKAAASLVVATRRLDAVTSVAARAQGDVLDARRRRDALARAIAREDDVDPEIGSYRFGSGGPVVSAASIDEYLESRASPMAGSGAAFLKAGIDHDIDPRLLVAIAGAESYFGLQTCAPFNGWGWGCPNAPYRFRSWAEAVDTVAAGLRKSYLDDGLTTVGEIHLRYAPPNADNDPTGLNFAWPDNVARFLTEQGGDPQDVTGLVKQSR